MTARSIKSRSARSPINPVPAELCVISDKNTLLNMSFMCILMHMIVHMEGALYENDIEYSG